MRHLVDHRKLGRTASHRRALLRNMAASLIMAERIETTLPKAKELRRVADRLVTLGKRGTLHARRHASRFVHDPEAVKKLFSTLADRFRERQGGYTRIYHYGFRQGDAAEMAAIEYLGYQLPVREEKKEKKKPVEKKVAKANKKEEPKEKPKKEEKKKRSFFSRKKKDEK